MIQPLRVFSGVTLATTWLGGIYLITEVEGWSKWQCMLAGYVYSNILFNVAFNRWFAK